MQQQCVWQQLAQKPDLWKRVIGDHHHIMGVWYPHVAHMLVVAQELGMLPPDFTGCCHIGMLHELVCRHALQDHLRDNSKAA